MKRIASIGGLSVLQIATLVFAFAAPAQECATGTDCSVPEVGQAAALVRADTTWSEEFWGGSQSAEDRHFRSELIPAVARAQRTLARLEAERRGAGARGPSRVFHDDQYLCRVASMQVDPSGLPSDGRVGFLARETMLENCVIRFSGGDGNDGVQHKHADKLNPTFRGLALKCEVPQGEGKPAAVQDFLTINAPMGFADNADEFIAFMSGDTARREAGTGLVAAAKGGAVLAHTIREEIARYEKARIMAENPSMDPADLEDGGKLISRLRDRVADRIEHIGEEVGAGIDKSKILYRVFTNTPLVNSLATTDYWSAGQSFRLGGKDGKGYGMRYQFVHDASAPAASDDPKALQGEFGENFLNPEFESRLAKGPVKFDLYVQLWNEDQPPIEQASGVWVSNLIKVGTVTIPQDVGDQAKYAEECQNLRFTVWNSVGESDDESFVEPIGSIGRIRKDGYNTSGRGRRGTDLSQCPFIRERFEQ